MFPFGIRGGGCRAGAGVGSGSIVSGAVRQACRRSGRFVVRDWKTWSEAIAMTADRASGNASDTWSWRSSDMLLAKICRGGGRPGDQEAVAHSRRPRARRSRASGSSRRDGHDTRVSPITRSTVRRPSAGPARFLHVLQRMRFDCLYPTRMNDHANPTGLKRPLNRRGDDPHIFTVRDGLGARTSSAPTRKRGPFRNTPRFLAPSYRGRVF